MTEKFLWGSRSIVTHLDVAALTAKPADDLFLVELRERCRTLVAGTSHRLGFSSHLSDALIAPRDLALELLHTHARLGPSAICVDPILRDMLLVIEKAHRVRVAAQQAMAPEEAESFELFRRPA